MPLPSPAVISKAFPHFDITHERRTFQNCLWEGNLHGRSVFVKAYTTSDHYQTEKLVLHALNANQRPRPFRFPQILAEVDVLQTLVMTKVFGGELAMTNSADCIPDIVRMLRALHQEKKIRSVTRLNMAEQLARYQRNISRSDHLTPNERAVAIQVLRRLQDRGLRLCHENDFIHGDMNRGNILYDHTNECPVALIDFERAAMGDGMQDVAKFTWRVLANDQYLANQLLAEYLARSPTKEDKRHFTHVLMCEYVGAVSYFAYRGYQEHYPFKDEAINLLQQC